jgi:6-phospho-beta-glucosidase
LKIGIVGGAGVRTPLLSAGLAGSDLPLQEIALYDPGRERLALIAPLAQLMAPGVKVRSCVSVAECAEGADFVFTSFRVGGIEARRRNEAIALGQGLVGQETVGFAGWAMALATIPEMVRHAREIERAAPRAWIVNFTNPVGMVSQAVHSATGARIVGICDTPTELFEEVAAELGVKSAECHFDYSGLNHLGWLREVYHRGEPRLDALFREPARIARVYRAALFEPERLAELKLLPTEYVYFYDRPARAIENLRQAGESRGAVITRLNERLFSALARHLESGEGDPVAAYRAYLADRDAGYMQLESGSEQALERRPTAELTGYDRIALQVVRAIHFGTGAVIPLDVLNRGNIPELEEDDVIEVPCVVNASGPQALSVPPIPAAVRGLLQRVKQYERITVRAALEDSRELALEALSLNPLVADRERAERLAAEMSA